MKNCLRAMGAAAANPNSAIGIESQRDIIGGVTSRAVNIEPAQEDRLVQDRFRLLDNYRVVTPAAKGEAGVLQWPINSDTRMRASI